MKYDKHKIRKHNDSASVWVGAMHPRTAAQEPADHKQQFSRAEERVMTSVRPPCAPSRPAARPWLCEARPPAVS